MPTPPTPRSRPSGTAVRSQARPGSGVARALAPREGPRGNESPRRRSPIGGAGCDRADSGDVAVPEGRDGHAADGTRRWRETLPRVSFGVHRSRGPSSWTRGTTPEVVARRDEHAGEPVGDVRGSATSSTLQQAVSVVASTSGTALPAASPLKGVGTPLAHPPVSAQTAPTGSEAREPSGPHQHGVPIRSPRPSCWASGETDISGQGVAMRPARGMPDGEVPLPPPVHEGWS